MIVIALDPGTEASAFVVFNGAVVHHGYDVNAGILSWVGTMTGKYTPATVLVIEEVQSYGMAVGREVFETVFWAGRFAQKWAESHRAFALLGRRDVKLHLCQSPKAKDTNIRQALYDRFGPGRATAVGTKKMPGPLYGIRAHEMAALAVAVTWYDQHKEQMT